MKKVFLLQSGDAWLSSASLKTIGVFETKEKLIKELKKVAKLNKDDLYMIEYHNQTQGNDVNYNIEVITLNKIQL